MGDDIKGQGVVLSIGTAAESLTAVARVLTLKPGKVEAQVDEATPLDATAVEKVGGIPDNGEVTAKLRIKEAHIAAFRDTVGLDRFISVRYPVQPDAKIDACAVVVKSYEPEEFSAKTGAMTATVVLAINGAVARTTDD